jgi:hypothetical protein
MWLLTITHCTGWIKRIRVFVILPKWVHRCMGLTVGLVVNSVNVCSTNVMWLGVECVEREVQVQYEMLGQNMCIDEMIVFLVFLFCVVVKCSSFWRNVLPPSSRWPDCIKWMLKWCGGGRCVGDIWYQKYKVNILLTMHHNTLTVKSNWMHYLLSIYSNN